MSSTVACKLTKAQDIRHITIKIINKLQPITLDTCSKAVKRTYNLAVYSSEINYRLDFKKAQKLTVETKNNMCGSK